MRLEQVVGSITVCPGVTILDFEEVLASGRPALYEEFGDLLLYLEGTVFILQGAEPHAPDEAPMLDPNALPRAVGIESGWRHSGSCDCEFCIAEARRPAA
jgi:hypothetical protein